jgi:hypothetical protein
MTPLWIRVRMMRIIRAILAVLLALLWVPMTNSCLIAASLPGKFPAACECEHETGGCAKDEEPKENLPCSGQHCAPCAILESGVNLLGLTPVTVPEASWRELMDCSEMLRLVQEHAEELLSDPPPVPPPSPPPGIREVVSMALPVRGPSLFV